MVQKICSKMQPVSCANTHHDITDLLNHGMVKNIKTWISWEGNITFLQNKKFLNLCLRWHILRSYRFVVEVTFKAYCFNDIVNIKPIYLNKCHQNKIYCLDKIYFNIAKIKPFKLTQHKLNRLPAWLKLRGLIGLSMFKMLATILAPNVLFQ